MAVAALVLGILAIVVSLVSLPLVWSTGIIASVPLALAALLLGVLGRKRAVAGEQPVGLATAGLVLGVVGVIVGATAWGLYGYGRHAAKKDWEKAVNDPAFRQKLNDARLNKDFDDAFNQALGDAQKQQAKAPAPAAPAAK